MLASIKDSNFTTNGGIIVGTRYKRTLKKNGTGAAKHGKMVARENKTPVANQPGEKKVTAAKRPGKRKTGEFKGKSKRIRQKILGLGPRINGEKDPLKESAMRRTILALKEQRKKILLTERRTA